MKIKIRARFIKGKELRFISHLDLLNTMNRALRRAKIPVAYSQGYNPTPNISFASALAVGLTSDSEYIDVELEERIDAMEFKESLNKVLPTGLEIIAAKNIEGKKKSLMALISQAEYLARIELNDNISIEELRAKVKEFLVQENIMVRRKRRRKKDRVFDIKPLIFFVEVLGFEEDLATIKMLVQTGSSGNLRPEEVINALAEYSLLIKPAKLVNIHRLEMYAKSEGGLVTPLEVI